MAILWKLVALVALVAALAYVAHSTQRLAVRTRGAWEVAYVPGVAEMQWTAPSSLRHTCEVFASESYERHQTAALRRAMDIWRDGGRSLARTHVVRGDVLSQLVYCPLGSGLAARGGGPGCRVEVIEPLTGTARHPFADVGCSRRRTAAPGLHGPAELMRASIFNISHLVLGSRCTSSSAAQGNGGPARESTSAAPADVHGGRSLLFDAGCTVWGTGRSPWQSSTPPVLTPDQLSGSALGPSMPLFNDLYATRCIHMDEIHGWEARRYPEERWWRDVPSDVKPRVHFYNVPIALGGGVGVDPLQRIAATARPEDFVVFKLDIDTFHLERAFVDEMLTNKLGTNATLLIDEFLFEYHFATPDEPELHTFWPRKTRGGSLRDAVRLMTELRRRGVRSHFWI